MRNKHSILVVDDEPDVVESVQELLRREFKVLGATSGKEGIEILGREEVHVIMTDQRMSEMTGVEFLSSIRGEHPEATRLLFTGYADIHAVIDAINQGSVYRYISKPWDPDELLTIIREACERYDLIVERKTLLAELQGKNTELERANELKASFINLVSHELRTPVTILVGMAPLVLRVPGLPEQAHAWVHGIKRASERLRYLVDQTISILVAGKYERPLVRTPIEVMGLVRDALDDIRPFVELRQQKLTFDVPADLGTINVEAAKIRDSINHLLLNAIKFTPDGGQIEITGRRSADGEVQIKVRDAGVGIPAAEVERLFQPFSSVHDVSKHSTGRFEFGAKGLGLGLSVSKLFVEMHGGAIAVETELGRGTTFTITLPAEGRAHDSCDDR